MLCDADCSHTALPQAKGMHQPRDSSALFPRKHTNNSSRRITQEEGRGVWKVRPPSEGHRCSYATSSKKSATYPFLKNG